MDIVNGTLGCIGAAAAAIAVKPDFVESLIGSIAESAVVKFFTRSNVVPALPIEADPKSPEKEPIDRHARTFRAIGLARQLEDELVNLGMEYSAARGLLDSVIKAFPNE